MRQRKGKEPAEREPDRSFGTRLGDLFGRSRRARLLTLGTGAALVVAVVAFIVLPSDEDEGADAVAIPRDAYTRAADRLCVEQKQAIVAVGQAALSSGTDQLAAYADGLVPVALEWRQELGDLSVPAGRAALAQNLELALREVAVQAGELARVARDGAREEAVERAADVDAATAGVEGAVAALGLSRCDALAITLASGEAGE